MSELGPFAVPPKQTSIEDGRWVEHQHLRLSTRGPNCIPVAGNRRCLPRSCKHLSAHRAQMVRGVGTDLAADTPVAPVNNWLHSLFSQMEVYLNDTLVSPSSNTYPFRAYVDTYWVAAPRRIIFNSPASCDTRTPPDTWVPRPWIVEIKVWLNDEGTYPRVESSRWWGGFTSTSSFKTCFFSTVSVSS